jgi:hypothetical protein
VAEHVPEVARIEGRLERRGRRRLFLREDRGLAMAADIDGDARPFDGDENGTATVDIGYDEAVQPLAVVPGDIAFGNVPLARSSQQTVTLTNDGSSSLDITDVALSGAGAADFSTTGETCSGATLGVGASCTVPVTFVPSAIADRAATLTITGPGAVGSPTVLLNGSGVDPIDLSPASFPFGEVTVGDPSKPGTITVTNSGGVAATITSIGVSGDAKAEERWRPPGAPYPMPPLKTFRHGEVWVPGFESVGITVAPGAVGVNSTEYQGRAACIHDGWCGARCPTEGVQVLVVGVLVVGFREEARDDAHAQEEPRAVIGRFHARRIVAVIGPTIKRL